jgi:transposase
MFDLNDDARAGYRRVEVLTGPGRRRRWSAESKAQVVAESLAPGARPSEVARRWQICPQQVFAWRREARAGLLALPAQGGMAVPPGPDFVPICAEPALPPAAPALVSPSAPGSLPAIEVEVAGAVVRVLADMDVTLLTSVLRAVRASAGAA